MTITDITELVEQEREADYLARREARALRAIARDLPKLQKKMQQFTDGDDQRVAFEAVKYLMNKVLRDPPKRQEVTGAGGGPLQVVAPMARPNLESI